MSAELPHCSRELDYSCERPKLRFADGGRFLQLSFKRSSASEWNDELFGSRGGVRGQIKGFSFSSRRRMLNRLNSVSVGASLPQFVTMTLPDDVFCDDVGEFAKRAKHWLDVFTRRLVRACPSASGFWRIEWQSRKSGAYEGKLFPHFHLLVWGLRERCLGERYRDVDGVAVPDGEIWEAYIETEDTQLTLELLGALSEAPRCEELERGQVRMTTHCLGRDWAFQGRGRFVSRCSALLDYVLVAEDHPEIGLAERGRNMAFRDWASLAWYHVVDSHNVDHLKAGVRVERVRSWGGVRSYASKYVAKLDCEFLSTVKFGRSWGIFNRAFMPWAKIVELDLSEEVGVRVRRIARRYLERVFGRRVKAPYGITLYCDVARVRSLWESGEPPPF
jgi:hypothetical protein